MAFDINNLNVSGSDYLSGLENMNNLQNGDAIEGSGISAKLLGGLAQAFQGLTMANDGAKMAEDGANFQAGAYRSAGVSSKQGGDFQAKVYRQAGQAALVAANYNIALDQQAVNRQQDAVGRQLSDITSTNFTRTAANGIQVTSRSTMAVQADVFNAADKQWVQNKNDALQRQSLIQYQGQLTQVQYENEARAAEYSGLVAQQNYENQARGAEYQGKVDAYKIKSQSAQQIGGAFSQMMSSFGG